MQAVEKTNFGFDLHGASMASDAFFPFPDCTIGKRSWHYNTTRRIIKDQLSIDYCNENKLAMVFTGTILNINLFNFVGTIF
jgi:phosphoribosylaminoimidazolecarboxamide formyltransferase/IMP cyclohydrolase